MGGEYEPHFINNYFSRPRKIVYLEKFTSNIERHRNTRYVFEKNLHRYNRTPLLEKETKLVTEYDMNVFEVISKKRVNTDSIPVHISLFIYQMSKLWLYQFMLVLFDYLEPNSFTLAYIGDFFFHKNNY